MIAWRRAAATCLPVLTGVLAAIAPIPASAAKLSAADSARVSTRTYVSCIVENDMFFNKGVRVFAFLHASNEQEEQAAVPRLAGSNCLQQMNYEGRWIAELKFKTELFRGQLFRALYLQDWGLRQGTNHLAQLREAARARPERPDHPLRKFGDCVVARNRASSDLAIRSRAASADEQAAYAALAPALSACLAPGSTMRFSKMVIEGALAESLFASRIAPGAAG